MSSFLAFSFSGIGIPFVLLEIWGSYGAQVREAAWPAAEADASGRCPARHRTANLTQACVGATALVLRRAAVWRPLDMRDIATGGGLARAELTAAVLAVAFGLADFFDFTQ